MKSQATKAASQIRQAKSWRRWRSRSTTCRRPTRSGDLYGAGGMWGATSGVLSVGGNVAPDHVATGAAGASACKAAAVTASGMGAEASISRGAIATAIAEACMSFPRAAPAHHVLLGARGCAERSVWLNLDVVSVSGFGVGLCKCLCYAFAMLQLCGVNCNCVVIRSFSFSARAPAKRRPGAEMAGRTEPTPARTAGRREEPSSNSIRSAFDGDPGLTAGYRVPSLCGPLGPRTARSRCSFLHRPNTLGRWPTLKALEMTDQPAARFHITEPTFDVPLGYLRQPQPYDGRLAHVLGAWRPPHSRAPHCPRRRSRALHCPRWRHWEHGGRRRQVMVVHVRACHARPRA